MPLMLREIKDLKDLRFFASLGAIDMQVLTDLKSQVLISSEPVRDQAIPNYRYKGPSLPNYSCAMLGEGQALALRLARGSP